MRIKVSVLGSRIIQNINIQNIEFNNKIEGGLPKIYFKCDRKFEYEFEKETLIFNDKHGKELFRSSNAKLDYRYYEEGRFGKNKVKFVVDSIELEKLGAVSKHYMSKILKKSCNAKVLERPKPRPLTPLERIRLVFPNAMGHGVQRFMDVANAKRKYAKIYRYSKIFRYIFNEIHPKFMAYKITSTAPT